MTTSTSISSGLTSHTSTSHTDPSHAGAIDLGASRHGSDSSASSRHWADDHLVSTSHIAGAVADATVAPARSQASFAGDPASQHSLVRLQREWGHLARSPQALAMVRGWTLQVMPFRSLDDVLVAAGLGARGLAGDHDDALVSQLVVLAREHSLAGRIVLQRLLPGVAAIVRRRTMGAHSTARLETTDEVLVAAWSVIRAYRVERYPTFVVPSMLREIERRAFRPPRPRRFEVIAVGDELLERTAAPEPRPTAAHELAELLDDAARSGLDPADIELIRRLGAGASSADLAAEHDVTDRTIRNHRAAAVHRLRAVALASG